MHYRMVALLPKEQADNSIDARIKVNEELSNDSTFCNSEGGYFSSPIADWFVIGGRWSGDLQEAELGITFYDELKKAIPPTSDFGYSDAELKANKKAIQKIWEGLGGKGDSPFTRDTYLDMGYEDDAMMVTKNIFNNVIKDMFQDYEYGKVAKDTWHVKLIVLDEGDYPETLTEESIVGKYWAVIVDYHN